MKNSVSPCLRVRSWFVQVQLLMGVNNWNLFKKTRNDVIVLRINFSNHQFLKLIRVYSCAFVVPTPDFRSFAINLYYISLSTCRTYQDTGSWTFSNNLQLCIAIIYKSHKNLAFTKRAGRIPRKHTYIIGEIRLGPRKKNEWLKAERNISLEEIWSWRLLPTSFLIC